MLTLKNLSLTTASSTLIFFASTLPSATVSLYSITELPFRPSDINDNGQIIGSGYLNGQQRNFLLTPTPKSVPEPISTFSLLSFAAFGIGWQMKRQRNKKKSDDLIS